MSVASLNTRELEDVAASLHKHLTAARYQTGTRYQKEDAYRAMAVIGIANRTAAFLTYGSDADWDDPRDLQETEGKLNAKDTYTRISNLLYNCTSNDGTDCMPERYRRIVEMMRKSLIEHAARW